MLKCEGDCGLYYKYVFGLELVQNAIFSYISLSTVFSLISLAVNRLRYWLFFSMLSYQNKITIINKSIKINIFIRDATNSLLSFWCLVNYQQNN